MGYHPRPSFEGDNYLTVSKGGVLVPSPSLGQWLNWQSSGLQNRRLGVRFPPVLPYSQKVEVFSW